VFVIGVGGGKSEISELKGEALPSLIHEYSGGRDE
jgi:hypothetical protein